MEDLGIDQKYVTGQKKKTLGEVGGSYTYFAEGDVLIAKITPCFQNGKLGIARDLENGIGFGSSEYIVLRPGKHLDTGYLYYFLSRESFREEGVSRMGGSVGQQRVPPEFILGERIPVPPLPEQQRIVGILDEAFAGIATAKANAEKNLRNASALFESKLQGLFSQAKQENWPQKKLADIGNTFGRGKSRHRPRNEPKLYGGKYPFIQTGDVRNAERVVESYSQTYSEMGLAQSKLWPKGTICITIAANIAETAILGFDACIPDSIIGLIVDEKEAETVFVLYLLRSFKAHLQAQGKGFAQHNINMGTFENQLFPIPALSVQRKIVATLEALAKESQRLESLYHQKLAALDALKKSLLHQAFNGQLARAPGGVLLCR